MLLTEAFDHFKATQNVSPNTLRHYSVAVRSLVSYGIKTTQQLSRANVAEWIASKKTQDLAAVTINSQLASILAIASALEREGRFPLQRLQGLWRLRLRNAQSVAPRFLSREEVTRLRLEALAVDDRLDLALTLAIFGGLRLMEIRFLHGEDMHLTGELPYINVLRTRAETHNRRDRAAPIAKSYAALLAERRFTPGPIFPGGRTNPEGCISRETFRDWLRVARDRAELFHVTWFVLRHTFASWLRQADVGLDLVSGFMGNTRAVCERFYASMGPGGNAAVEKGFAAPPSDKLPHIA